MSIGIDADEKTLRTEDIDLYLCVEFNAIGAPQGHSKSLLTCTFNYAKNTGFTQSCATFAIVVDV